LKFFRPEKKNKNQDKKNFTDMIPYSVLEYSFSSSIFFNKKPDWTPQTSRWEN